MDFSYSKTEELFLQMISQKPYKYAIIHTREEKQRFLYKCKLCCLWSDVKSHNADIPAFVKV